MFKHIGRCVAPLLAVVFIASCAGLPRGDYFAEGEADLLNERLESVAVQLSYGLRNFDSGANLVAVTTFVELDGIDDTSAFGRYVSEQLSSELFKMGMTIRDVRKKKDIEIVHRKGEFILTRKSTELMKQMRIDAVLAGTYSLVGSDVVINARLLSNDGSNVISVGQTVINIAYRSYIRDMIDKKPPPPPAPSSTPVVKVTSGSKEGGM